MAVNGGDRLTGRVALVTGASGGIGGAVALLLARQGADLALGYGHRRQEAEDAAAAVTDLGRRAVLLRGDLGDPDVPGRLVEQTVNELGSCDVLVANAGVGTKVSWDNVDLDLWQTTMDVNLRAPWLMTKEALPGMIERRFGRILYLSSVAALNGGVVGPHYASSKAGLHGLMHHLAPRVAGNGITVNAIAPALIGGTRMMPMDPDDPHPPPMPIPVGRLGTVDEVASMAVEMVTNAYLTNKLITVDGGIYPA